MKTITKEFRVLSIDALVDGMGEDEDNCQSWSWNNWHHIDMYSELENGELTEENALKFFFYSIGYRGDFLKFKSLFEVYDDGYNLTLVDKKDQRPLYAIEYGCHY